MAEQNHVCRKCGHVGVPNWVHWVDGMDGGYTPRCTDCNSVTYTKREWLKQDYAEKFLPVFMGYFAGGLLLILGASYFDDRAMSLLPVWFIGFILMLIINAIGERKFVSSHEDE